MAETKKFKVTDDVLLFKKARGGADAWMNVPEGTEIQTDGVRITSQDESGTFHFVKAKVNGKEGYIIDRYVTEA